MTSPAPIAAALLVCAALTACGDSGNEAGATEHAAQSATTPHFASTQKRALDKARGVADTVRDSAAAMEEARRKSTE